MALQIAMLSMLTTEKAQTYNLKQNIDNKYITDIDYDICMTVYM